MNKISKTIVGLAVAGIATLGVLTTGSASAATPAPHVQSGTAGDVFHNVDPAVRVANAVTLTAGQTMTVDPHALAGSTTASISVTAVSVSGPTDFLSLFATGTDQAGKVSQVTSRTGQTTTTGVIVSLGADGKFVIYNHQGTMKIYVDFGGSFTPAQPAAAPLAGAYYSVAKYDVGDTNGGAIATVACKGTDVAISGGVQTLALGTNGIGNNVPVSSSFPGRMDFSTNTPKPGDLTGWVVQFGTETGAAPKFVNIYALCVPGASIPVDTTFTESGN